MLSEVFLLALALSMDAFAVSIGLGSKINENKKTFALKAGFLFGFFQGFMPLIGYLAGVGLESYISEYDHWVAFALLFFIGAKMIYEAFGEEIEEGISKISSRLLFTLAVATSIDALAAGFTLPLFQTPFILSILIIAIVTFVMSFLGVFLGSKSGNFFESKAEFLGGFILIGIGTKILLEHLGFL